MKSLLLKDLIALKSYSKTLVILIGLFIVLSFGNEDMNFLSGIIILMMTMLTITSFSYDQYAKWDLFSQTLPISRKDVVMSKYLLGILSVFSGGLLAVFFTFIISLIRSIEVNAAEIMIASGSIILIAFLFIGIVIPLVYKFGVERSRMITIAVLAVPSIIVVFLSKIGVDFSALDNISPSILLLVGSVCVIGLLLVSYSISAKIYMKKDF